MKIYQKVLFQQVFYMKGLQSIKIYQKFALDAAAYANIESVFH